MRKYDICIDLTQIIYIIYILQSSLTHLDYKSADISKQRNTKRYHFNLHQPSFSRFLAFF